MLDRVELLDALPCATVITDGEGHVLHVNAALENLAGRPADGWSGQRIDDLLPPASRIFLQTHLWPTLLRTGRVDEVYLQLRGAQGKPVAVLLNAKCYQSAERSADMRVSWAIFQAGERQRFEHELLRARQRLQQLMQSTNAGTWEWNVLTGELRINDRWASRIGWSIAELGALDQEFRFSVAHPDELPRTRALLQQHLEGSSEEYVDEVRLRHRDGSWVWVQDRGRVVSRTEDGQPEWMFGVHIDISAIKQQEQALRRSEELLNRTNELAGVGGWELDLSTQALYWSAQTCRIHGVPPGYRPSLEEALAFYPQESRSQVEAAVQASLAGGGGWDLELPFIRRDGTPLMVHSMGEVHSESGVPVRLLGAFQDVTLRHSMTTALRQAKAVAEAASAAKSMFLANMSHEIRTPMNAVIGVAHLLADTPLDPDQRQLLSKLQLAGRSLLGIINDVLDLAKIEAGELSIEQIAYRPAELLAELDSVLGDQARAKGLAWTIQLDEALPAWLMGDPQRLRQVLINLLSNAVKFTKTGSVGLALNGIEAAPEGGQPRLRFSVRDTGIGVSPLAQAQLFKPFVQAEASTTRRFGGTGLGLSIVKHLVELMGGAIELHSQPGQGSEFVVELPLQAALGHEALPSQGPAVIEAVVVEDEAIQRERLAALCTGFGWRTQALATAEALLDLVQRRQQQQQALPDVLLMDWHLGSAMDGLSALRRLRAQIPAPSMPTALLITQDDRGALRAEDIEQLVDAVLAKPAEPSTLFNAVSEATARRGGNSERLLSSDALALLGSELLTGVTLLVVDDSDINLEVARRMLEQRGASVHCESQAEHALARLQGGERFDAVLMDIQMPGMDGLDATQQIRQQLALTELPVIALTAGALLEERRRALAAGMDDFLTKPLDPEALVRTLRRHIEARRGVPMPVRAAAARTALPGDWPQIDGIAAKEAALRLGGDAALFRRLLARLLEGYDAAWQRRLPQLDATQCAAELHKLRGSAGLLGAQRLHALATQGEAQLRSSGDTPAALAPLFDALGQALRALHLAAQPWLRQPEPAAAQMSLAQPLVDGLQRFAELLRMLQLQDLDAGRALLELQPWLREQGWAEPQIQQLQDLVDELDYEPALQRLSQWVPTATE